MAIESRWFRVRRVGDGSDENPYRPEYSDRVEGFSGFRLNQTPVIAMRAFAEPGILDEIAGEPRASEIANSKALKAFNDSENPSVSNLSASNEAELNQRFRVTSTEIQQ
jgi:hypothetical protein